MATQVQFQVFKGVYDEENHRYTLLAARAQLYFTLISLYLGAFAFKLKDVGEFASTFKIPLWAFTIAGALVAAALLGTVLAIRIRKYEVPCDLKRIIDEFGDSAPTDETFLDDRLVDYAVATERNVETNNKVAGCLAVSSWLLFAAAVWHLALILYGLRDLIPKP